MNTTNDKSQRELLDELCARFTGHHFRSAEWLAACAAGPDWSQHWPIIDRDGKLTGEVFNSDDEHDEDYANVEDDAMIAIDGLPSRERLRIQRLIRIDCWDGYATLSKRALRNAASEIFAPDGRPV